MVSAVSKKTPMIVYSNLVPSRALYPAKEKVSGRDVGSTVPNFSNDSLRSKRFLASSSRKLGREQKKRKDGGGGGE